jgi:hypothetical protein
VRTGVASGTVSAHYLALECSADAAALLLPRHSRNRAKRMLQCEQQP